MTWLVLGSDGRFSVHTSRPELEDLQKAVGGYIEAVPRAVYRDFEFVALCNEQPEQDQEVNQIASWLLSMPIMGPVIFIGAEDEEGELTSLPPKWSRFLHALPDVWLQLAMSGRLRSGG